MILLLDNFDSFTYNLLHYIEQLTDEEVVVKRNDALHVADASEFSSIILSPGPGLPSQAGIMMELIKTYCYARPILGVCLGHQALCEVFGARLLNLNQVMHGVSRQVNIVRQDDRLFTGLPATIQTGHYHSWVVDPQNLPEEIVVTAHGDQSSIMAFSHKSLPASGIQFHPESVMTPEGMNILKNWLRFCCNYHADDKKAGS